MKLQTFTIALIFMSSAHAQNVGIGTTTPLARLHVTDSSVVFSATGLAAASPGNPPISGNGRRMMWYPDKAAFRVGYASADSWDKLNVGNYSFGAGYGSLASGIYAATLGANNIASGVGSMAFGTNVQANTDFSTAIGFVNFANGFGSTAIGVQNTASGRYASTFGYSNFSKAYGGTVVGMYNDATDAPNPNDTSSLDRIFQIGIGYYDDNIDDEVRKNAITVLRNGNTGIGTVTPQSRLHVLSSLDEVLRLDAARPFVSFYSNSVYKGYVGKSLNSIEMGSAAGSALPLTFAPEGIQRMFITASGNVGIQNSNPNAPLAFPAFLGKKITLYPGATGDVGFAVQGNVLQVYADHPNADVAFGYDQSNVFTERMRVKGSGNVGIGTINPQKNLSIQNGMNVDQADANIGSVVNSISFGNNSGEGIGSKRNAGGNQRGLDFYTNSTNKMSITNSGNVGIGTTTPAATFEVNGYTKLGSDAPLIKVKKVTGTTAATEGSLITIQTGVASSKILSVSVLVLTASNNIIGPNVTLYCCNEFTWSIPNGFSQITIQTQSGNSSSILSRPVTVFITYEE